MTKKRLLILTSNVNDPNPLALAEACEQANIQVTVAQYADLQFVFMEPDVQVTISDAVSLFDYDYYILRGAGTDKNEFMIHRGILASILKQKSKRVLNGEYYHHFCGGTNKLQQLWVLLCAGVPVVDSKMYGKVEFLHKDLRDGLQVVKAIYGSHGVGVHFVKTKNDIQKILTKRSIQTLLFQPLLPNAVDYRVIVIGKQVIGVMRREASEGGRLTNISAGGVPYKEELTEEMERIALKACEALGLEYAGVDLMRDVDGRLRVLETNSAAEFRGFVESTRINVPKMLVEHLIE